MAEGRARGEWGRTASLLALIANCNRDPRKTRAFRPADFNPYDEPARRGIPITADTIGVLKALFVEPVKR